MALIDKETIRTEIERLRDEYTDIAIDSHYGTVNANHVVADLEQLLSFLDTIPEQPVSDHHEIEVEFRGEKVTISREFYRDGERNYSTSEQDDNAIWSALRAWCEKKGITPFELYPKQSEQPVEGLDVTDFCKPIDPDIAQCVADHFWEMIGEESTNKKPVEGLEEEYVRFAGTDHHKYQDLIGNGGIDLARHFAEWGAEHLKR